jgi:putative glutamine amidotransferase
MNHRQMEKKMEKVHEVELTADSILYKITGQRTLGVNSTHHQSVGRVAKPLRATAKSSDGVIEALELKEPGVLPFLLAVQFHPERLLDRYKEFLKVFRTFVGCCAAASTKKL